MLSNMINKWLLLAILVIGFALGAGMQQVRYANLQAEHYQYVAEVSKATAKSAQALADYQVAVQDQLTFHRNKHNEQMAQIQAELSYSESGRAVLLERLRNYARSRTATKQADETGGRSTSKQDHETFDLFINMLDRHSRELQEVGEYADKLYSVGLLCEQMSDSWSK